MQHWLTRPTYSRNDGSIKSITSLIPKRSIVGNKGVQCRDEKKDYRHETKKIERDSTMVMRKKFMVAYQNMIVKKLPINFLTGRE